MKSNRYLSCLLWITGVLSTSSIATAQVNPNSARRIAAIPSRTIRCLLASDHTVFCSGRNNFGQVGNGTTTDANAYVQVPGLTNVEQLVASEVGACARLSSGAVHCWGRGDEGALGYGTQTPSASDSIRPHAVDNLTDAVDLASNGSLACAIRRGGNVVCWGRNSVTQAVRFQPTPVTGIQEAAEQIAVGSGFACARTAQGVYCWGSNFSGILGSGIPAAGSESAVRIAGLDRARTIATGTFLLCGIDQRGQILCTGRRSELPPQFQPGSGDSIPVTVVPRFEQMQQVSVGPQYICGINQQNTMVVFGNGQERVFHADQPTPLASSRGTTAISCAEGRPWWLDSQGRLVLLEDRPRMPAARLSLPSTP